MIVYNVTVKVNKHRVEEWIKWMKETHIPEVMATNLFTDHQICELLQADEDDGKTFVIQYHLESKGAYNQYQEFHAAKLQQASFDKFGEDALGFRTLMKKV